MFRTADAAGVGKVHLAGYTPAPLDKFKRPQREIAKTALGAEHIVPWEKHISIEKAIQTLRTDGFFIAALEQGEKAIDYRMLRGHQKVALIVGNEVEGIEHEVLTHSDQVVHIPMHGKKESLNVSVAAGIALFHIREYN